MLEAELAAQGIDAASIDPSILRDWTLSWHRLAAWPDALIGLSRLKSRFPIVTLSNGNISMMLDIARKENLPWDAILGAEVTRAYKPSPSAYLATAEILAIKPEELCLVAAHHSDLAAARRVGLRTAYVDRPLEYGGGEKPDIRLEQDWDWRAADLVDLAGQLGC
jgi:2-haloacid dehalogenase